MGKRKPIIPSWVRTVGAMREAGVHVRWTCRACDQRGDADLAKVDQARGPDFSLINRRPRCRQPGCNGHVLLLYSPGASTPVRPLQWSEEGWFRVTASAASY